MILKLTEPNGGIQIHEVRSCAFRRLPEAVAVCDLGYPEVRTFPLEGNAYVMNDHGVTIEVFYLNRPTNGRKDHR